MSKNFKLDTKVLYACGTIFNDSSCSIDELKNRIIKFANYEHTIEHYYVIRHDAESDDKSDHFHYLFHFNAQIRLSTLLNRLESMLGIGRDFISVEKCIDFNSYLRYMLHIGEDKKQYAVIDLISDLNVDVLQKYVDSDDSSIDVKRLFQLVMLYDDEVDLMYHLGLPTYHRYRHEIHTLYDRRLHLYANYKFLYKNDADDGNNNLPF